MRNGWHLRRRCWWLRMTCCCGSTESGQGHLSSSAFLLLNAKHESAKLKGFGSELDVETTNTGQSVSVRDVRTSGRRRRDWSLVVQPMGQPAQTRLVSPFWLTRVLCLFWLRPSQADSLAVLLYPSYLH